MATLVVVALATASAGVWLVALPGVGGAESRTTALLAARHSTSVGIPPPTKLGLAVVAVEDEHFQSSFVVNTASGVLLLARYLVFGGPDPGGSTLEQQLARNLYLSGRTGASADFEELGLAFKLDRQWSKDQLLQMYLDDVYFGNGFFGAEAAAEGYFGIPAGQLDWTQAALLAGLPQAPSAYNPFRHPALARSRRTHVLAQLAANHILPAAQAARDSAVSLGLRRPPPTPNR